MNRITKEELLQKLFHDDYEQLTSKELRMTRLRVPGKEVCLAHILSPSQTCIYQNLGLHIGVHEGEDHTGESIGLIRVTPWEAVVVAADVAIKSADIQIGFMDRFCGSLIITGGCSAGTDRRRIGGSVFWRNAELSNLPNPKKLTKQRNDTHGKTIFNGQKRSRKNLLDTGPQR